MKFESSPPLPSNEDEEKVSHDVPPPLPETLHEGHTDEPKREEMFDAGTPPPLPETSAPEEKTPDETPPPLPTPSALRERDPLTTPRPLTEKEASKQHLAAERVALAEEIRQERMENRRQISQLEHQLSLLEMEYQTAVANTEQTQTRLQELTEYRAEYATTFAGRIRKMGEGIGIRTRLSEIEEDITNKERDQRSARTSRNAGGRKRDTTPPDHQRCYDPIDTGKAFCPLR